MLMQPIPICPPTDVVSLERTRFFPRQLITPDDLTQDQIYLREKLRRHNRLLHGWGVVCGAEVKRGPGDWEVVVQPGYILGPYGDEILIDREVTVDLSREGLDGNAVSPCGESLDIWCSDVRVDRKPGQTLYLAVRYADCQTRPVRVQPVGCGCDETECEYSRIRDSYAVKVLTRLPATYTDPMPQPNIDYLTRCPEGGRGKPCVPCPTEPWVILADITLGADGKVEDGSIDCFAHRRYVLALGEYYFLCKQKEADVDDRAGIAGEMRRLHGDNVMADLKTGVTTEAPKASAAMRRADGTWMSLPVYFSVEPRETYGSFLAREGDRQYYDLTGNRTYTLRELYAMAEVDPDEKIENADEAVSPLEGLRLKVEDLRVVRSGIAGALDGRGLERMDREHAGSPVAAAALPATDLAGVGPRSALGKKLAGMSVADVASMEKQAFIDKALEGVPAARHKAVERQAAETWTNASKVNRLSKAWRE
jgi:hypothetical protein